MFDDKILDLNASEIEDMIEDLIYVENLALSEEGLGKIETVIELFEANLKGEYKEAMVLQEEKMSLMKL